MMFYYLDGACHRTFSNELPDGAVQIARLPERGEVVDPDGTIRLDQKVLAGAGLRQAEVDRAAIITQLEATLILSGYTLTSGMIYELALEENKTALQIATEVDQANLDSRQRAVKSGRLTAVARRRQPT